MFQFFGHNLDLSISKSSNNLFVRKSVFVKLKLRDKVKQSQYFGCKS